MLAISHAATALLVKRCFPQAPMPWILLFAEAPAVLRLLAPDLHAVLPLLSVAFAVWLLAGKMLRRRALAGAAAAAIVLHLAVDFVMHAEKLVLAPYAGATGFGLALYETPPLGMAAALVYGLLCWLIFGGGKALLALIVLLGIAPMSSIPAPALQFGALLVWYFSRARAAELEHPDRRLARAFA